MGGIDTLNGSYDAFFHHSSIAFIRDSGDAFLTTALIDIYGEPTFYPVTWAVLAALLPFGTGASANAMMLATLAALRSEEHTSELQSRGHLVCRLLLEENRLYSACSSIGNNLKSYNNIYST